MWLKPDRARAIDNHIDYFGRDTRSLRDGDDARMRVGTVMSRLSRGRHLLRQAVGGGDNPESSERASHLNR